MPKARTHAERLAARDGYFAPGSVIRRLGNSPVTPFLGGGAAVLLQVAHPLVACGVVEHSGYDRDLWRRLVGTLRALYLITFGDTREADEAAATVRRIHARVHGFTATQLGRYPAGTPYSAGDPELMLWVHATLVHSSLAAYEQFVQRLSLDDKNAYYREMSKVAMLFGAPDAVLPPTYSQFQEYWRAQIASDAIVVTPPAREVASVILAARLPAPLRILGPAHRLAAARILPARLRHDYGLRWSPLHEAALPIAGNAVRYGTTPLLTVAARVRPPARFAPRSATA